MAEDENARGVDRRELLRWGALSGVAGVAGVAGAAGTAAAAPQAAPTAAVAAPAAELEEATIADLQARMASGELTARRLAEAYLERGAALDRSGPALRSVIEENPDALAIAEELDRERRERGARGPLHGIPVLLKDNIDTGDRMQTTAGSLALLGAPRPRDAFVVERLRAAGAVVLGKTNLSEWANFRSTKSSSGWSGRGGQTKNPYALDRNPCGSSSGSGVAVAANLGAVAVGTETDGSVVCPATINGIVGVKPTLGLVSRAGIIPIAHSQDTAGPMARSVRDAAILLSAMAGADPRDAATGAAGGRARADYAATLDGERLAGVRLGVSRSSAGFNERVDKLFDEAIGALRELGATLVDPADLPNADKYQESEYEVLLYEFKADLNAYLAARGMPQGTRTLAELVAWNEQNREREMPFFGQEIFLAAEKKGPLTDKAYRKALKNGHLYSRAKGIDQALREHQVDALLAPTGSPAWPTDLLNGDHFTGGFSSAAAVAGYPHVTVPMGFVAGLPVGLSVFGTAWSESLLLKVAHAFEQATKHRRAPRYLPTAELGV